MSRMMLWVTTVLVGIAASFMTSFVGPAVFPLLTVAVIVMVKADRLIAVSGLMTGLGGSWLLLLANQFSSGGTPEDATSWFIVGIVPLAIGLMLFVLAFARSLLGHQQARR